MAQGVNSGNLVVVKLEPEIFWSLSQSFNHKATTVIIQINFQNKQKGTVQWFGEITIVRLQYYGWLVSVRVISEQGGLDRVHSISGYSLCGFLLGAPVSTTAHKNS